ncbi:MAG: HlyC/CorC family transporter [Lachnospiraceae bacterium]|nr:HlyC/CorC family transporter [Lachnospiraceae bacterium]
MDTPGVIQLIILFLLLVLSAFFSSAETALTTVNKIRIKGLAEDGKKSAIRLEKVLSRSGKMLSAILIGNNIVNISATSLATALTIRLFGSTAVGLATGILTILVLLFGEILPKTWATLNAEKLSFIYCYPIDGLMYILTPVIFLVDKLANIFLRILGIDPNAKVSYMTESELKTYVDVSHEDGVIESEEREMILNVFDFGDSYAKDIMIPRIDMCMVDVEASYREVLNLFKETMYSRIPVYENETDNIIGIITLKDFFFLCKKTDFKIRNILRDTYYTYEYKKTNDLLMEMRGGAINIAIVLDEYGASVGLITLEDLLEEIVGEIRDEYDESEDELIREIGERTYLVEGSMKIDDINDSIRLTLDSENYDSIGGLMLETLDRLPQQGEEITLEDGTKLIATTVQNNRVEQVTLILPAPEAQEIPEETGASDSMPPETAPDEDTSDEEVAADETPKPLESPASDTGESS